MISPSPTDASAPSSASDRLETLLLAVAPSDKHTVDQHPDVRSSLTGESAFAEPNLGSWRATAQLNGLSSWNVE